MIDAIELAAGLCDSCAAVYGGYAGQEHRPEAEREQFARDQLTCTDLGRRIRALRDEPDDWSGVQLTLDRCERIYIDHPDEAALGRIYMELIERVPKAPP